MAKVTVLGIGNILMGDEGVGVRLLESVQNARDWPSDVEFVDGGVGGLSLLSVIERAERLVVFDAADMGLEPGAARVILPEQVDIEADAGRMSLHQLPFAETLELCRQHLKAPADVRILAIQVDSVDEGLTLSPPIQASFTSLRRQAIELIEQNLRNGDIT